MRILGYFDRYGDTKNEVIILVGTSLVLNFGFGVLIPFMPLYARDLGATIGIIGIIIAAFTIGRAVMSSVAGAYSDRIGRRKVMIWGTALYGVSTFAMAFSPNWETLLILRVVEGAAVGIVWPTAMAYLVDIVPRDKVGEATGMYTTSFALGFFVGPMLGSGAFWVTKQFGASDLDALRSTFYVTAFMALIAFIVITLKIRDFDPEYYDKKEQISTDITKVVKQKLDDPRSEYRKYYTMAFFNGVGIGFIIPIFTIFFVDVHNFDEALVGLILGISGGIMALMSVPSGAMGDRIGRRSPMLIGLPIMVFFTGILGFASTVLMAAGFFWIRAIGNGLFMPNFRALQADVVLPKERGTVFGRVQTFFNIGAIFGPIAGSYLYQFMEGKRIIIGDYSFIGEASPFFLTGVFQSVMFIIVFKLRYPRSEILTIPEDDSLELEMSPA
ncbi:MAG: MFS transporter [Candidatus Heimdallarchaeota archaeon]|nr:MFS transporter [Candidatus Heimdallarchaeota archaeon]